MSLRTSIVMTLFRTELRMVLRDRRMFVMSILLPMLVTPLMFLGSSSSMKRHERSLRDRVYYYALSGSQAEAVRGLLAATRRRLAAAATNPSPAAISPKSSHGTNAPAGRTGLLAPAKPFQFEEVTCTNTAEALAKGEIQLAIEALTTSEAPPQAPKPKPPQGERRATGPNPKAAVGGPKPASADDDGEPPVPGALVVRLLFRGDRDESANCRSRLQDALEETRRIQRADLLRSNGFPLRPAQVAGVSENDVASKAHVAGLTLGRTITLLLLAFILTSGAVVATDSLAGEKERGTLETLLTTAANRVEILAAKQMVVLAVAFFITLVQAANLLVYVGLKLLPVPANLAAAAPPGVVLLLLLLFLPVAALAANALLLISGYARSYKEAQMYFLPAFLVGLLPAAAPFLPGLTLRSAIVLVPVANLAVAVKEVLIGTFDWPMIALAWLITAGTALWTTRLGVRFLSAEKLITAADTDRVEFAGGPVLFERRVLRWFAVLWAVLLLVNNYYGNLDVRLQLLINLVGLFFGASCLMLWRYRLDPRAALALRPPRPEVWLGVLAAIPGGFITALGIFELTNLFLPVPEKVAQAFGESVVPESASFVSLLLVLSVLPGIFEEIAFRGLLLHGLRRRLPPAGVAVVVGLAFGIFHVALFRFVPTACLGVLLAAVTLLTGSIFPAMVWHCFNNACGLLAYKTQIPEAGLGPACYLPGVGLLAVALWIFWRHRTPYPGLRQRRSIPDLAD